MLRSSLIAAMMLAFSGGAGAAGLGRINVLSALGQPLRAEIEISASGDELESMSAKIASLEAYQRANIEYSSVFSAVRMSVEKRSGKGAVLRILSSKPINEPFVDMLVELNWAGGRLLREYTFLLDPTQEQPAGQSPILAVDQPVAKPLTAAEKRRAARKEKETPPPSSTTAAAAATPEPEAERKAPPAESGGAYTVRRGDTLSKIAAEVKPVEISQEQMIAALYKANAQAFMGGNINRLRTGRVLHVPDAEEAKQVSPRQARKVVLKASNFEDYQQKVASSAAAAPAKETAANQASSGKVEPKVEDKVPAQTAQKDKVKVTSTQTAKAANSSPVTDDAGSKARVQALQDTLATRDKELKEANSRIKDLDKNITELKKLIDLKNQDMADAQRKADEAIKAAAAKGKKGKDAQAPAVESPPVTTAATDANKPPVVEASAAAATADSAPAVVSASEPAAVDATASAPAEVAASAPAVTPKAKPITPPPPPEPESDIPYIPIAGGGALAILAILFVWLKARKRRKSTDLSQLSEVSTASPNSVFGSAVGQTIDTGGTSLLHTDFSQSGMASIDADEGVDPVAEADVYMAYGRDAQAEEILLDALKTDPNRNAIYIKLLEIYAQRRSLKQFENIAAELHTRTNGVGDDWAKAVALGIQLDPNNPLFRSQSAPVAAPAAAVVPPPPAAAPAPVAQAVEAAAAAAGPVTFGTNNVSQMRSTWTVPGEIDQINTTAGPGEMPVVDLSQVGTASVPDSLNLDFNLDLDSAEVEEQPTRIEPRKVPAQPAAAAPAPEVPVASPAAEIPLEFDIGFDDSADQTGGVAASLPAEHAFEPPSANIKLPSLGGEQDDMDVGIESAHQSKFAEVDLEKTNFEGSLLDFDFELGEEEHKPALDLSGVDLRASGAPAAASVVSAQTPATVDLPDLGDDLDVGDEIGTKLELAHAYEEMGDVEGARELLEEVVADGNATQKDEARAILQRLGA
ncbi:FimV/HubP family polar landmark protein [Uliginosibacterium gangwonense]|uniref:FimV/HubP family polar landmark protein n=1 Tax=Uliginosibacterium gangwonense TaxID=392736 RepID=UPI00036EB8B3|nr:FimV/HubP family polar landmark protein [Uliginosibacterium gangwonense]